MRKIAGGLVAIAVSAVLAAPAHTATFSTPMLQGASGGECLVSNVGTSPVNLTVTLYNPSGGVVAPSFSTCGTSLGAGETCLVNKSGSVALRCTVDASSTKIRAALSVSGQAVPATKK
jgi:hypothetical protein